MRGGGQRGGKTHWLRHVGEETGGRGVDGGREREREGERDTVGEDTGEKISQLSSLLYLPVAHTKPTFNLNSHFRAYQQCWCSAADPLPLFH